MKDRVFKAGSTTLWTMTALSAIIGEGIDGSQGEDSEWPIVTWKSRPWHKPAFVAMEWNGDECAVTVTPGWEHGNGSYDMDVTVQRIIGYCAIKRIPCAVNEAIVQEIPPAERE